MSTTPTTGAADRAIENCPELNMGNYDEVDVERLNDWAIRANDEIDRPHALAAGQATATPAGGVVAYLDIGAGGYLDLGTDLSNEAISRLPKGRHALIVAGTYGIDGYTPTPPAQAAAQQGVAYAALPTSNYAGRVYEEGFLIGTHPLYTADQVRAFADATHALRASHGQASSQAGEYPALVCDYCGALTPDPWHSSGMLHGKMSKHIHSCDACAARGATHPYPPEGMAGWISVKDRLPEKNTVVLICFAELSIPSTGQYTASALDHEGWCYPQENRLWPGEHPDFEDGGSPTVTHWMKLPEAPALLMERAMSDTTTPKGQALTPAIGGLYNWKGQPERLVYMGERRYPGSQSTWHQFAKVETPEVCWSEVLMSELAMLEETKGTK